MRRLRPLAGLVLALSLMLAWVLAYQHVKRMDGVWFQPSVTGAWALARYLAGDYAGAARAYRSHYREAVASGWSSGDRALDALLAGDLDRAASAARTGPSGERGLLLTMSDIALERGRPDEAMVFLRQALERAPDDVEALLLASLAHARGGAPGEAIVALTHALRHGAAGARVTIFLRILETTGELARRQGAGDQPCLLAHYHRYLAVFDASNGRRALAYAEQAVRAADRPADAYLVRGILLDRQGQRDRALEALHKALEIDPRHADAYRWATFIHSERGDLRSEYRIARAAFDAVPTSAFYLEHLDHVLMERLGDAHGAIAVMQRAVEVDPDNARAHEGLGRAWHRLGRTDEAIAAYRQAAAIAPRRYQPHTGLAAVYEGARRPREAIAEYETAVRLGEPALEARAALCAAYHAAPELPRAVDCPEGRR